METYNVKLIKTENPLLGLFLNKKVKAIGHGQMAKGYPADIIFIMSEKKVVSHLSINNYLRIEYSKELFEIQNARAKKESGGLASVN